MSVAASLSDEAVRGPAWTPNGLQIAAGRFPLSVEAHLMAMTSRLVPGATTVTTNARYYAVHGLAALTAAGRDLDRAEMTDLLRRCEVVFGAAAILADNAVVSSPHGAGPLREALDTGELDVATLAAPRTGFSRSPRGFWGPYIGSELTLGILDPADPTRPGPRSNPEALLQGLHGLVETSEQDVVRLADLEALGHLGLDASGSEDGEWLLSLFVNPDEPVDALQASDAARAATISLLLGAVDRHRGHSFAEAMRADIAFSDDAFEAASALGPPPEAEAWRGVLLRWYSVGAWRRLWKWLVDQLEGRVAATDELAVECAARFPEGSLDDFVSALPPTRIDGVPFRAEEQVRTGGSPDPVEELSVLLLGALRTDELDGRAREAFVGRHTALGPEWMAGQVETWSSRPTAEFVVELVHQLVRRSQRIALRKARLNPKTGRLWVPTRVYEVDGKLVCTSPEGAENVGLRVDQLGGILASLGVFERHENGWALTPTGRELQ